ncbi:DNA primase [Perkinsela sp. CCAP 1560/4]|nr:DNA primase [Perkinsela sp. CCAP 1560/4]|eukprot:KNH05530.1 DNA primase [Perkinsela sp. CCAP 1560/4]
MTPVTNSQESSQKIFSLLQVEEKSDSTDNYEIQRSLAECTPTCKGVSQLLQLHQLLDRRNWDKSDSILRSAFVKFLNEQDYTSFDEYSHVSTKVFWCNCVRFLLLVEITLVVLYKCDSFFIEDCCLQKLFQRGESVFTLLSSAFDELACHRICDLTFDTETENSQKIPIPEVLLSDDTLVKVGNTRLSDISYFRHAENASECILESITLKNYLALGIAELARCALRHDEVHDPCSVFAEDLSKDENWPSRTRSFLDEDASEAQKLSQSNAQADYYHSRNVANLARICLDSNFLIEILEESISGSTEAVPTFLLDTSIFTLEALSTHIHIFPSVLRSTFPLQDMFHLLRLGLARAQESLFQGHVSTKVHEQSERVVRLLRTALNLANEPDSEEYMSNKLFFNILQGFFLRAEGASCTDEYGDEIVLINCIFCAFLRKMKNKPAENAGLQWILKANKLHSAMGNVIHKDRNSDNARNQLRVVSSYCALFFGSISALQAPVLIANGGSAETTRVILHRNCLSIEMIVQKLQEFLIFQSEVGILTKETLTIISCVIGEIVGQTERS